MEDKRKIYKNKAFVPIMIITCLFGFLSIACIIFAVNYQKGDTISREYFIRYAIITAMIFVLSILYLIFGIINRKNKAALVLAYIISYCAFFIVMSLLATYPIFAWHTFKYNVILLVFIVAVITINIAVCIKNLKRKSVGETTAAERVKQMGNKTLILLIFFIDLIGLYLFITSFDSVYHLHSSWYNSAFYPEEIMVLFIISAAIILCSIIYFVSAIINNKSKLSYIFRQSIFYTFAALIIFFVHVLFRPEPFYLVIDIIMGLGVVSWFVYLLIRKYKKKQLPVDKNETSEENERQKENL